MHPPGVLQLSNVLSNLSIGMATGPSSAIPIAQINSESDIQLASDPATRSSLSYQTYPQSNTILPTSADSASHIVAGLSRNTESHGESIGAYEATSHPPHTDLLSDVTANPSIDQSDSASSGVPYEMYHAIDAPIRFILPVVSFLITSYLPQIREVIFTVEDDDDDKAALQDAVAREAASLPGDLGFRVAN